MFDRLLSASPLGLGSEGPRDVTDWAIRLNGMLLMNDARADMLSIEVYDDVNLPGMMTLRLHNWDADLNKVTWSDKELLALGSSIVVELGYRNETQVVFDGEITGLEGEFEVSQSPALVVRAHDRRHRLMRGRKTRSFVKKRDSDIVREIAKDVQLIPKADSTTDLLPYVLQNNQTNYEFLQERARRIGFEVVVAGRMLYFRERKVKAKSDVTLSLNHNLIECFPRLASLNQVSETGVRGWDPKQQQEIVGKAAQVAAAMGSVTGPASVKKAFGESRHEQVQQPIYSKAEADAIARGALAEAALDYITAEGTCLGEPRLRAGIVITLTDLGTRFSGDYYVTSAHHQLDPAVGYRTGFTARRNAT